MDRYLKRQDSGVSTCTCTDEAEHEHKEVKRVSQRYCKSCLHYGFLFTGELT